MCEFSRLATGCQKLFLSGLLSCILKDLAQYQTNLFFSPRICWTVKPDIQYLQVMELPIYKDNLRSSGDWRAGLEQVREEWQKTKLQPETLTWIRDLQLQFISNEIAPENFLAAAEFVSQLAVEADALTVKHLFRINASLTAAESKFREVEIAPINAAHDPALAVMLPRLLDNALGWFATEGFAEMNAVEQAALVYLRVLDLQPFAAANLETAMLAASFQIERSGLPPLIIDTNDARYSTVLETAFKMLTQHLVDYFAESLHSNLVHPA